MPSSPRSRESSGMLSSPRRRQSSETPASPTRRQSSGVASSSGRRESLEASRPTALTSAVEHPSSTRAPATISGTVTRRSMPSVSPGATGAPEDARHRSAQTTRNATSSKRGVSLSHNRGSLGALLAAPDSTTHKSLPNLADLSTVQREASFREMIGKRHIMSAAKNLLHSEGDEQQPESEAPSPDSPDGTIPRRWSTGADGSTPSPKKFTFEKAGKAIATAIKTTNRKTSMIDIFMASGKQRHVHDKLSEMLQQVMVDHDWPKLASGLEDLKAEMHEAELKFGSKIDFSAVMPQVDEALGQIQTQKMSADHFTKCLQELKVLEADVSSQPEVMWSKLLEARDLVEDVYKSAENLHKAVEFLGKAQAAPHSSDEDKDRAEAVFKFVRPGALYEIRDGLVSSGLYNKEKEEEVTKHFTDLGASKEDLAPVLKVFREEAWGASVEQAVSSILSLSEAPMEQLLKSAAHVGERLEREHESSKPKGFQPPRRRSSLFKNRRALIFHGRRSSARKSVEFAPSSNQEKGSPKRGSLGGAKRVSIFEKSDDEKREDDESLEKRRSLVEAEQKRRISIAKRSQEMAADQEPASPRYGIRRPSRVSRPASAKSEADDDSHKENDSIETGNHFVVNAPEIPEKEVASSEGSGVAALGSDLSDTEEDEDTLTDSNVGANAKYAGAQASKLVLEYRMGKLRFDYYNTVSAARLEANAVEPDSPTSESQYNEDSEVKQADPASQPLEKKRKHLRSKSMLEDVTNKLLSRKCLPTQTGGMLLSRFEAFEKDDKKGSYDPRNVVGALLGKIDPNKPTQRHNVTVDSDRTLLFDISEAQMPNMMHGERLIKADDGAWRLTKRTEGGAPAVHASSGGGEEQFEGLPPVRGKSLGSSASSSASAGRPSPRILASWAGRPSPTSEGRPSPTPSRGSASEAGSAFTDLHDNSAASSSSVVENHPDIESSDYNVLFPDGADDNAKQKILTMHRMRDAFSKYGEVKDVYISEVPQPFVRRNSVGFEQQNARRSSKQYTGFVTFVEKGSAQEALTADLSLEEAVTVRIGSASNVKVKKLEEGAAATWREVAESNDESGVLATVLNPEEEELYKMLLAGRVSYALVELHTCIVDAWGNIEKASKALTNCGGDIGGFHRIGVGTLHGILKKEHGYQRSLGEVCVLFQALGVTCTETATLSIKEFCRMDDIKTWFKPDEQNALLADEMFGILQLRRMLMDTMTPSEILLTQVQTAATEFVKTYAAKDEDDKAEARKFLESTLKECSLALESQCEERFVDVLMTRRGLRIFVDLITSSVCVNIRLVAISVLRLAVDEFLGKGKAVKLATESRAPSPTNTGPGRTGSPGPKLASEKDIFLASELWRPLLNMIDIEASEDMDGPDVDSARQHPLEPTMLSALLALFLRARVPTSVVGADAHALAPHVAASLKRLHDASSEKGLEKDSKVVVNLLKAMELLERSHETIDSSLAGTASQVHRMAAALGGCRILHEQLEAMPRGKDINAEKLGSRMLKAWRVERARLFLRWPLPGEIKAGELAKVEILVKAVKYAHEEDFSTKWPSTFSAKPKKSEVTKSPNRSSPSKADSKEGTSSGSKFEWGSGSEDTASAIEQEVMGRLNKRWEKAQKRREKLKLADKLPPSQISSTNAAQRLPPLKGPLPSLHSGALGPASARVARQSPEVLLPVGPQSARTRGSPKLPLHTSAKWAVQDHLPMRYNLFHPRARGAQAESGASSRIDMLSRASLVDGEFAPSSREQSPFPCGVKLPAIAAALGMV